MNFQRPQGTEVVVPILVRDLTPADPPTCTWSGSSTHLHQVARELKRARVGEVDYLAACTPVYRYLHEGIDVLSDQAPDLTKS